MWVAQSYHIFSPNLRERIKQKASQRQCSSWRNPGMEEPGGLPSTEPHRVGHDLSNLAAAAARERADSLQRREVGCPLGWRFKHWATGWNAEILLQLYQHGKNTGGEHRPEASPVRTRTRGSGEQRPSRPQISSLHLLYPALQWLSPH